MKNKLITSYSLNESKSKTVNGTFFKKTRNSNNDYEVSNVPF